MKVIPREAGRITYSTEIRRLKLIPFNDMQKAILIGSILGDGCLCENWSKTNYRFSLNHSVDQKEYLFWKYNVLKNYIISAPKFYERNNSLTIRTISHSYLTELRKMFYRGKTKIIPDCLPELINPLALAIWFMDDGNVVKRNGRIVGYHLNTQSFSHEDNKKLADMLYNRFEIETNIEKNKGKYRLAIWKRLSRQQFLHHIGHLIIPSMKYKISV